MALRRIQGPGLGDMEHGIFGSFCDACRISQSQVRKRSRAIRNGILRNGILGLRGCVMFHGFHGRCRFSRVVELTSAIVAFTLVALFFISFHVPQTTHGQL